MNAPFPSARLAVLALLVVGCTPPPPPPPPVRDPPQVFLTALESNVVGTSFGVTVNVTGCDKVAGLAVSDHEAFLKNVEFTASPTRIELTGADLGGQYATLGIAPKLLISVKATCDDGRTNKSMPVSGLFFPVEKVFEAPGGGQAVPDTFYAEGGLGGSLPTFVGCIGTSNGTALLRVGFNTMSGALESQGANLSLPFPCSMGSTFTERNAATGKRWMWERGVGALAYDQNLNITSYTVGKVAALTVAPDGDAIVFFDGTLGKGVQRIAHNVGPGTGGSANMRWNFLPKGQPMGNPFIISNLNRVRLPVFEDDLGTSTGTVWIQDVDYANGVGAGDYALKLINYGFANIPEIPPAAFSNDGTIVYFPYTSGATDGTITSRVLACATNATACSGSALRWESPPLPGKTLLALPFATGTQIAAIGARQHYSLSAASGAVTSFDAKPVIPDGALTVLGAQVGLGSDLFLFNGPAATGYPIEVIAIDSPLTGELYRYQMGGGSSPSSSMTMAVDDAGQAWLRIGLKLVKPLPLSQYRTVKGPNKMDP